MKPRNLFTTLAVVGLALGVLPIDASAQLVANIDQGMSERLYGRSAKIGTDSLMFIWEPELPMFASVCGLVLFCQRQDDFGNPVGNHKATFKKIKLTGVDSLNELKVNRNAKVKIKQGLPKFLGAIDLTTEVWSAFASDSLVLVEGTVTMTGKAESGDIVTCDLALAEISMALAQTSTKAQRVDVLRELGATMVVPRQGARIP